MSTTISLPSAMEKGTLLRWLKREGDRIQPGDILAEVETDKAMMELEATHEGVLSKIVVQAGSTELAADTVLAMLASPADAAATTSATAEVSTPARMSGSEPAAWMPQTADQAPAPVERTVATHLASEPERGTRIFASPRARRLASESGINLANLSGSGPRGRIIERDIEAAKGGGTASVPPAGAYHFANAAGPAPPGLIASAVRPYTEVPHDGMRRTIAQRLSESKRTVPHFYLSIDCELDAVLSVKDQLNCALAEQDSALTYKLTVSDFLIKAWALALMRVPEANVSWTEKALLRHRHADIGVAVAVPGGLMTPILRHAEQKSLSVLSNELKALAARAQERKLRPEEYEGGTSSLSNLGMFGIKQFSAILNPPQAAILAVGAAEKRVIVKGDQPAVATVLSCTLSVDHRAVDGAVGARVLGAFKRLVENPLTLFV